MRINLIFEPNSAPERFAELAQLAESYGIEGIWVSNMHDGRDPFVNFVPLALETQRIRMGPIAVSPFELHPQKMAHALLTLNELAQGRAQLVVGGGGGTAEALGHKPRRIVRAVETGRFKLVVGPDARAIDVMKRVAPIGTLKLLRAANRRGARP